MFAPALVREVASEISSERNSGHICELYRLGTGGDARSVAYTESVDG